jgi:hypothetical protein
MHQGLGVEVVGLSGSGRMSGGKLNISRVLSASRKRVGTL